MNMELHSTGASFIAGKSEHNPRDLVIDAIKAMPGAGRKEVFERFRTMLAEAGDDCNRAVEWYFFVNMHDYLMTNRNRPDPIERATARQQQTERVEAIKAQIMLDLDMPNGKKMRDCTGAEMARFGNRYQRIAEKVGKAKTVGSVLNEDQVKAIMK
jgi:hypothetical protein